MGGGAGVRCRFAGGASRIARIRSSTCGSVCGYGVVRPSGLPNSTRVSPAGASRKRLTHFLTQPFERPIQSASSCWVHSGCSGRSRWSIARSAIQCSCCITHSFREHLVLVRSVAFELLWCLLAGLRLAETLRAIRIESHTEIQQAVVFATHHPPDGSGDQIHHDGPVAIQPIKTNEGLAWQQTKRSLVGNDHLKSPQQLPSVISIARPPKA